MTDQLDDWLAAERAPWRRQAKTARGSWWSDRSGRRAHACAPSTTPPTRRRKPPS